MERDNLMKDMQMYQFGLTDLILYLDTHPNDQIALSYYHKYHQLNDIASREYSEKFGPVNPYSVSNTTTWDWVSDPWPWQI